MSNAKSGVEESKDQTTQDNQYGSNFQNTKEAQVNQLVQILNYLFEPNNLSNNVYLVYRSQGATFHIPIKFIYEENSIKAVTTDKDVINEALEQAENVVAIKKGDVIDSVRPARDQLQKNIIVKNITKENEHEFKQLVYSQEGAKENIQSCTYNNQLSVVTIICKDENFALQLYNYLNGQQFKDSTVDCVLNFENLYISALENIKKKGKRPGDHHQNRYNMGMSMQQYGYPYQMPYMNYQMNPTYKGGYFQPPGPFYMQPPVFDNRQMNVMNMSNNPNLNGNVNNGNRYNNYNNTYNPNKQSYTEGPKRGGGYNKRGRGTRGGGRYMKGSRDTHQQQTQVEVNDSDFPPLSNEGEQQ